MVHSERVILLFNPKVGKTFNTVPGTRKKFKTFLNPKIDKIKNHFKIGFLCYRLLKVRQNKSVKVILK